MKRPLLVLIGFVLIAVGGVSRASAWADATGCTWCGNNVVPSDSDGWNVAGLLSGAANRAGPPAEATSVRPTEQAASVSSAVSAGPLMEYDYRSTCDLPGG